MLQFKAEKIQIEKATKILAKYNIKASINQNQITILGDISEEMIREIVNLNVVEIANFQEDFLSNTVIEGNITENASKTITDFELRYPLVKRGEVYWAELPNNGDHVIYGRRPVIVISNDWIGENGNNVVVIPCTTHVRSLPTTKIFKFGSSNFENCANESDEYPESCALVAQITTVDKRRLKKYVGTMKAGFMAELEMTINYSLGLKRSLAI